jgi:hypothetical protein
LSEASDALYEWSLLLKQAQVVDVDAAGDIVRVTFTALHERDSEAVDIVVDVRLDTSGNHTYTPIVAPGVDTRELALLWDSTVNPRRLSDVVTSGAPLPIEPPQPTISARAFDGSMVPAALSPVFAWLTARYHRLSPERRAELHAHSKTKTAVGIACAIAILLVGCVPFVRHWLWVHIFLTPKLAAVDASVSGMCLHGHPFATVTFRNIPDIAPLVILRNDQVVQRIERVTNDRIDYKDTSAESNARYVYRLATPDRGEYVVSGAAMAIIPTCIANNHPPVVNDVQVSTTSGDAPLAVTFSVTAHDPDHDALQYHWDFRDRETAETKVPRVTHVFRHAGTWQVNGMVSDGRGGDTRFGSRVPNVQVVHGPMLPLLSEAEEARLAGFGEGTPDAGPLGTVFRFRVFPRRSSRGAAPVAYRWTNDKCRERALSAEATHTVATQTQCASDELSTPVYQERIPAEGRYRYSVDIRYADGEVEHLPIAVVTVGYREHIFRTPDGGTGQSIERVGIGGDYTARKEELPVGAPRVGRGS